MHALPTGAARGLPGFVELVGKWGQGIAAGYDFFLARARFLAISTKNRSISCSNGRKSAIRSKSLIIDSQIVGKFWPFLVSYSIAFYTAQCALFGENSAE